MELFQLSDCGLLTTYEIQFQNQNVFDSAFQKKFRIVVDEFVSNLQVKESIINFSF